jgi:hypothetical protein
LSRRNDQIKNNDHSACTKYAMYTEQIEWDEPSGDDRPMSAAKPFNRAKKLTMNNRLPRRPTRQQPRPGAIWSARKYRRKTSFVGGSLD